MTGNNQKHTLEYMRIHVETLVHSPQSVQYEEIAHRCDDLKGRSVDSYPTAAPRILISVDYT